MPAGRQRDLSNDQMAGLLVAVVVLAILSSRRKLVAASVGHWLQLHHIVLPPGRGLLTVGLIGSLDLPRILAAVAVLGLAAVASVLWLRAGFDRRRVERSRGDRRRTAAEQELD